MFKKSTKAHTQRTLPEISAPALREPASTSADLAVPPKPPVPARGVSTLASDLRFDGSVSGSGDLVVDGTIKGDVNVNRLSVGEAGSIEGNVTAEHIEIRGRVIGAVSGKQIRLIATAYVDGDITSEQLAIDIGAYFQGRVLQTRRDVAASVPAPATTMPAPAPAAATPAAIHPAPATTVASAAPWGAPPSVASPGAPAQVSVPPVPQTPTLRAL